MSKLTCFTSEGRFCFYHDKSFQKKDKTLLYEINLTLRLISSQLTPENLKLPK